MKLTILFEDSALVAVNKPSGMLSIPDRWGKEKGQSLLEKLTVTCKQKMFVVHRLDRDTSGIILYAKTADVHKKLSQLFEKREVQKTYVGLCHGTLTKDKGVIDKPLAKCRRTPGTVIVDKKEGKPSVTEIEVIRRFENYTWLKISPKTGRTHQIRAHLSAIGNPLVCDPLYGLMEDDIYLSKLKKRYNLKKNQSEKTLLSKLALHALSLKLVHPESKKEVTFEAPLRKDLKATISQLEKFHKG